MRHDERKLIGHYFTTVAIVLLAMFSSAPGQDAPGNKKPRSLSDYQSRTLKEILALKPDADDLGDRDGEIVTTRDVLPSRVNLSYGGSIRLLPGSKKEVIRQWARRYAGSMEHYTEPYQTEMLFIENGVRYWLATPKGFAFFKREPKKGTRWNIYLIRLGATVKEDNYDWTLLVESVK